MEFMYKSILFCAVGFGLYLVWNKNCVRIIKNLWYEVMYNLYGVRSVIEDIVFIERNKIDLPKKSGKVAVITGGSRGIGSEVVKMLLQCDMEVIITCRTPAAGEKLIRFLRESGIKSGSSKVYKMDNSSLDSVRQCAASIREDYKKIDVLINNAGIMFTPYAETVDGFEEQWAVNYLSHFLFTSLLMPPLIAAGRPGSCSRIVNVSSCLHLPGRINFEDINNKKDYYRTAAYGQSKLAQVIFSKSLQELVTRQHYHVETFSVHPGIVDTDLLNQLHLQRLLGQFVVRVILKNPTNGAVPIVYAAVSDAIEGKCGMYISNCGESSVSKEACDPELRQRLFHLSLQQTRLQNFLQAQ